MERGGGVEWWRNEGEGEKKKEEWKWDFVRPVCVGLWLWIVVVVVVVVIDEDGDGDMMQMMGFIGWVVVWLGHGLGYGLGYGLGWRARTRPTSHLAGLVVGSQLPPCTRSPVGHLSPRSEQDPWPHTLHPGHDPQLSPNPFTTAKQSPDRQITRSPDRQITGNTRLVFVVGE